MNPFANMVAFAVNIPSREPTKPLPKKTQTQLVLGNIRFEWLTGEELAILACATEPNTNKILARLRKEAQGKFEWKIVTRKYYYRRKK